MQRRVSYIYAAPVPALLGGLLMAASQLMIVLVAPVEERMGLIQKIFYLHLPLAWWGLFSFFMVFVCSLLYLLRRDFFWDALSEAAAACGLLLAVLALATGSIWARISWNTWWTWDPRLTTTLVLCFIYAGFLLIRRMDMTPERRGGVSAALGIIAFLDVPLVFFSARLWPQTIHPQVVTQGQGGGLDPSMRLTLICCLISFGFLWAALLTLRFRLGRLEEVLNARLLVQEPETAGNHPQNNEEKNNG
ncbi:MAG: cytochrome c biogenesis protein CcsA [Deltaproteobacteria bacterium]|jgi:heme exporter protein C|nr:cytochrome c biogenesis protein CcsA [Deltaproteobacteria bacterium]